MEVESRKTSDRENEAPEAAATARGSSASWPSFARSIFVASHSQLRLLAGPSTKYEHVFFFWYKKREDRQEEEYAYLSRLVCMVIIAWLSEK